MSARCAWLVLGLAACTHKPAPKLQIEVTFEGNADLGRLARVAEVEHTSREKTGFIFSRHDAHQSTIPVNIEGQRLQLAVPTYDADEYDLTYLAVHFQTDIDRRLGTAVSRLSFIPSPATQVPPLWREGIDSSDIHGLGYYYEQSTDGVFRTRRYFLGEFIDLNGPGWSSIYFSSLENTRKVEVVVDVRPLPYFEDLRPVPPEELASEPFPSAIGAAALDPSEQTAARRFEVADFERLNGAKIQVAAVDPSLKLPFWDGQKLYPFAADWSLMRPSDFSELQNSNVHRRAKPSLTKQTWSKAPNNVRLPNAGRGQVEWRYVEGAQQTSFVIGLELDALVFVRRAP